MRIAINTLAMKQELHGVGNYIKNLVWGLSEVDHENEYLIIASSSNLRHLTGLPDSFRIELAPSNAILRVLWEQIVLPLKLKREKIDIFHGPSYAAPLVKTSAQIVTIHDLTFKIVPEQHPLYRRLYLRALTPVVARRCDRVIAVSESTKRDLLDFVPVAEDKVCVIHLGVERRFQPIRDKVFLDNIREKYNLQREFILFVGVIEPRKNLEILVDAYLAHSFSSRFDLLLAGTCGWDYSGLIQKIAKSGVKKCIHMPGYVADVDLPGLLSLSSVFIYPSLYEGFGLPVLEAMACGTPVISSSVSSIPEVTGEAAILVDPKNVIALGEAMHRVLYDSGLRETLVSCGVERAGLFKWERTAWETLEAYRLVGRVTDKRRLTKSK